jgi:flagellar biosynthesis regulator FlbT
MTLKLTLKPGESVCIGTTRLTVRSTATCTVLIDGDAPVMRAGDMLEEADASEPMARFRFVIQEIYLRGQSPELMDAYVDAAVSLIASQPDIAGSVQRVNAMLRTGTVFEAVKFAKRLAKIKDSAEIAALREFDVPLALSA